MARGGGGGFAAAEAETRVGAVGGGGFAVSGAELLVVVLHFGKPAGSAWHLGFLCRECLLGSSQTCCEHGLPRGSSCLWHPRLPHPLPLEGLELETHQKGMAQVALWLPVEAEAEAEAGRSELLGCLGRGCLLGSSQCRREGWLPQRSFSPHPSCFDHTLPPRWQWLHVGPPQLHNDDSPWQHDDDPLPHILHESFLFPLFG